MHRKVHKNMPIAQNHNQSKKLNGITWGISTDGSGAFALLGV